MFRSNKYLSTFRIKFVQGSKQIAIYKCICIDKYDIEMSKSRLD